MAHVCLRHSVVLGGVCQLYLEELPTVESTGMQEKEDTPLPWCVQQAHFFASRDNRMQKDHLTLLALTESSWHNS